MTTSTPETATPTPPQSELSDSERSVMSIDTAEQWRDAQKDELNNLRSQGDVFGGDYIDTFNANIDDRLDAYLQAKGLEPGSAHYNEARQSLRNASIDRVSDDEWYTRPSSRGDMVDLENDHSGRDVFARRVDEYIATHSTVATAEREDESTLAEWRGELASLRDELATLMAKRHGRIAGKGGEEYEAARARYNDQLIALGKLEKEAYLNDPTKSDEDKRLEVTKYLFDEQAKLHQATTEKLANTPTGKFIGWMTKGKVATRIAKGLALGVGVGIAGAAVGAVAGVAGAAAIGAGVVTAATTATRYARGFAMHFGKEGRSMRTADADQLAGAAQAAEGDSGEFIEKINAYKDDITERELKRGQRKTRMAVGAGVLSIVAGAGLATAAHAAIDSGFFNGDGNRFIGGGAETDGGERPVVPEANTQTPEDARAQAEADKAAAEAEARKNAIPGSDTPAVADAIHDALGGGPSGDAAGAFAGEFGATTLTPGGLEGFSSWMEGYTVKSGDSIWSLSEQYLHSQGVTNPSVYQIDAAKDAMLAKLQAHGLADANGWLQAGQRISLE